MNIPIELLVVLLILFLLVFWTIWFRFTQWRAIKSYKPENDKSKFREERRRAELEGRKFEPSNAVIGLSGLTSTEGQELLQNATPDSVGEDSKPVGSDNKSSKSRSIFSIFGRKR